MSLTLPLSVRLVTSRADRNVTRDLRSLSFRSVVPGGFASATFSLDRPLTLAPDEIAYYGKVYIYDARNGSTVWEGRLEDPGRGVSGDGQVWQLAAVGPSAHASDRTVPLVYVDRQLEGWVTEASTPPYIDRSDLDFGVIRLALTRGVVWVVGDAAKLTYSRLAACGQKLGRLSVTWDAGTTSANDEVRLVTYTGAGGETVADSATWSTSGGTLTAARGGSPAVPAGDDTASLRIIRLNSNLTVPDDVVWATLSGMTIRALLKTAAGTDITTGYTLDSVLASEVVADLLGRLLTAYDGDGATIATTTYPVEQLAYWDGATPAQILADLIALEPGYTWAAWESNTAGKHRFEWSAWPATVRYSADVTEGFTSPGSADGLYNAVRVRYLNPAGAPQTVQVTGSVAELSAAGLTREAFIDLGQEVGTAANATQAGQQFLAEHATPPNAGTLTVASPVRDLVTGRMVAPWEIRPGQLIRVRGVLPRADPLNATTRDGVTVFRIVAVNFDAAAAAATLELDSQPPTVAAALATLQRAKPRRR